MKKVTILGCGPAGLLAAHACTMMRVPFVVYALKGKSLISGAQFLHESIEGLDMPSPSKIAVTRTGDAEGYALKVYGDVEAPCSFDSYQEGDMDAWPMLATYELLWALYEETVQNMRIYPADIEPLLVDSALVINTIPRNLLCRRPGLHQFDSQAVFFKSYTSERDLPNHIVYSGDRGQRWYRASWLFGHGSLEYSLASAADLLDAAEMTTGIKPLENNCTCHQSPRLLHVGRFGKWEKGVLVHHAFQEVCGALQQL